MKINKGMNKTKIRNIKRICASMVPTDTGVDGQDSVIGIVFPFEK